MLCFLKPTFAALRKAYELCSMFRQNRKGKISAWKVRAVAIYQLQIAKAALVQLLNRNISNFQEPVRIKKYLIAVEGILADRRVRETDGKVQWMFNTMDFATESWKFHRTNVTDPDDRGRSNLADSAVNDMMGPQWEAAIMDKILDKLQAELGQRLQDVSNRTDADVQPVISRAR